MSLLGLCLALQRRCCRGRWLAFAPYLGAGALACLLLRPALSFEFASDDRILIVEDQRMRDPSNWWRMATTDAFDRTIEGFSYDVVSLVGHWRPISKLSWLADYTLWGPNSARFHLTGALIHLCAGLVVAWLCRLLGSPHHVAAFAALLFLVHPVAARPVGLVSLRSDLWCGLFSLLCVACFIAWERRRASGKALLAASYGAAFLALLGKETGVFLPLFFGLYLLATPGVWPHRVRLTLRAVWPYGAVVGLYGVIRFGLLHIATGKQNEFAPMGPWSLFISLSRLAFSYLTEPFLPTLVDRLWLPRILSGLPDPTVLVSWAGLVALAALVWRSVARSQRGLLLALLLLALPVVPLLRVESISGEDVGMLLPFEAHRMYIPVAGTAILWALAFTALGSRHRSRATLGLQLGLIAAGAAIVAVFPGQLQAYRNTESMVERKLETIGAMPFDELPPSLQALRLDYDAVALKREGRLSESAAMFARILEIRPYDPIALKNLAVLALLQRQPDQAIAHLETVLNPVPRPGPDGSVRVTISDQQMRHTGEVQRLLGQAFQMKKDYIQAQAHLMLAHKIDAHDTDVLLLLAWNATLLNQDDAARDYLGQFLTLAASDDPRRAFATAKLRELSEVPAPGAAGQHR